MASVQKSANFQQEKQVHGTEKLFFVAQKRNMYSRAKAVFKDLRKTPLAPASYLDRAVSLMGYITVKAFAMSMNPGLTEPSWWTCFSRKTMRVVAPFVTGKPAGVITRSFNFNSPNNCTVPCIEIKNSDFSHAKAISGEWVFPEIYEAPSLKSKEKIILYLPGGGYYLAGAETHGSITGRLALDAHCPVCVLNYRHLPEQPYPAALNDLITLYNELLNQGYRPENMVLSGDSAGAHLATEFVYHLQEYIKKENLIGEHAHKIMQLGLPCALLALISPIWDFHITGDDEYAQLGVFHDSFLPRRLVSGLGLNLGRALREETAEKLKKKLLDREASSEEIDEAILSDPRISPRYIEDFSCFPPIFLSRGRELLDVGIKPALDKIQRVDGVHLKIPIFDDQENIAHSTHLFARYLPTAGEMLCRIGLVIGRIFEAKTGQYQDIGRQNP